MQGCRREVGQAGWLRAEIASRSERVEFSLGFRRAGTHRREAERKAGSGGAGVGPPGASLEVLPRDLERSRCAARPRFAVRGQDDLGIDRVESIERGERDLTVVV
jgi:hypothetical protein